MQTSLRDDDLPSMQMADVHDVFDEFKRQLPDIDPQETQEWIDSIDALVKQSGADRARFVLYKLLKRAHAPRRAAAAHADALHQHDLTGAGAVLPRRRGDGA